MYGGAQWTHDRSPPGWAVDWLRRLWPDRRFAWNNHLLQWEIVRGFKKKGMVIWKRVGLVEDPITGCVTEITRDAMEVQQRKWWLQDPVHRAKHEKQCAAVVAAEEKEEAEAEDGARIELFRKYHKTHLRNRNRPNPRVVAAVNGTRK